MNTKEMTAKVELALRRRFCMPEWATFFEVWGESNRQADCIAFNMFRSRGFRVLGFEIKASRNDWQKELSNGHKADYFVGQCDEWYIVEAEKGIVKPEELPKGWGLITLNGERLFTKVKSDIGYKDKPSREFFVRMIQKAHGKVNVGENVIWEAERRGIKKGRQEALEDDWNYKDLKTKAALVDKLEEDGLRLWNYGIEDISKVKLALELLKKFGEYGLAYRAECLLSPINKFKEEVKELQQKCKEMEDLLPKVEE